MANHIRTHPRRSVFRTIQKCHNFHKWQTWKRDQWLQSLNFQLLIREQLWIWPWILISLMQIRQLLQITAIFRIICKKQSLWINRLKVERVRSIFPTVSRHFHQYIPIRPLSKLYSLKWAKVWVSNGSWCPKDRAFIIKWQTHRTIRQVWYL